MISNSTFSRNVAYGDGYGGCIDNGANPPSILDISNSTFSENSVGSRGGCITNGGTITITNSTLSNNAASLGGGIYNYGGIITLTSSTLSDNQAYSGSGIHSSFGSLTLGNSLIAGNRIASGGGLAPLGKEIYFESGAFISQGHNLFGENGVSGLYGIIPAAEDLIPFGAVGTVIGPLANNGGPTQTHLPVTGSLAINRGDNTLIPAGISTDQRGAGFLRIIGGTVDIGAVEGASSGQTTFVVTATTGTGGSVTPTSQTVNSGDTTNFTVTANIGYAIQLVTGCGGILLGNTYTTGPITGNCTINASFKATSTTSVLTVIKTGTGSGTVSGGGSYAAGATVTLIATPDTGSTFTGWSPSPCAASFAMPANNLTCTATFTAAIGNDIVSLQSSSPAVIGAGSGDDIYILNPSLLTSTRTYTLTDTQGNNVIQLAAGLQIASSALTSNALRLTLTNGARIDVYGANGFLYAACGNAAAGLNPTPVSFATFATATLGVATVPANASTIGNGGAKTITCP